MEPQQENVGMQDTAPGSVSDQVEAIMAQENHWDSTELTPLQQEEYLGSYSWAAAIWGPFYFWAMNDKLFALYSLLLPFPPLSLVLALSARRRAWEKRQWHSFAHFVSTEKTWQKDGYYYLALLGMSIIAIFFTIMHLIDRAAPSTGTEMGDIQEALIEIQKQ